MRFGLSVPNFGDYADLQRTVSLARRAEDAGWDGFFVWDHVLCWNGNVVADPWILLAAIAVATKRIRIGTMVTPLARRRPWQVARQAVTLDHLSRGRVVLGVGLGSPPHEEFGRFGEPVDSRHRSELLDEGLAVVAGLMAGEPFSFEGRHFSLDGVEFAPRPIQQPRIPIWIGGFWPNRAPFRRGAHWDGIVPLGLGPGGEHDLIDLEGMRAVVDYTEGLRPPGATFDRIYTGLMAADRAQAADTAQELASFGVTWWQISPGMGEDPAAVIDLGPPRAR